VSIDLRRALQCSLTFTLLSGCGSSAASPPPDTGGTPADASADSSADSSPVDTAAPSDGGTPDTASPETSSTDGGGGGATIAGSVGGAPFVNAATSLWIGAPDSPTTIVVYVFSKPVDCATLNGALWDKRIPNDTQVLELKMIGTTPGTYKVATTPNPAAGEASVNYTLSKAAGGGAETSSTTGTVTLTATVPNVHSTGSFSIKFPSGQLDGTYDAVFCPAGTEP
jgi:hypothetical protein